MDRSSLSATLSADGKAAVELYKVREGVQYKEREEEGERERKRGREEERERERERDCVS